MRIMADMSERMTDEAVAKLIVGTKKGIGNQAPRYYVGAIGTELQRARASEVEKDATIKALADALLKFGTYGIAADGRPCWCTFQGGTHMAECEAARNIPHTAGR